MASEFKFDLRFEIKKTVITMVSMCLLLLTAIGELQIEGSFVFMLSQLIFLLDNKTIPQAEISTLLSGEQSTRDIG